jgi:hypothetical protein
MPKVSKTTATTQMSVPGLMDAAMAEVDGYSVEIERWDVDMDFAFTLKGLPNDQCQAHHVGYILKGKMTFPMDDGSEEVFEAGDAVVLQPGHNAPTVAAGSEWVLFTPAEEANAMAPVVQANMMKYAQEHGIELPS